MDACMVPHLSFIKFGAELTAEFYAQLKVQLKSSGSRLERKGGD